MMARWCDLYSSATNSRGMVRYICHKYEVHLVTRGSGVRVPCWTITLMHVFSCCLGEKIIGVDRTSLFHMQFS